MARKIGELTREYIKALNQRDLAKLASMYTDDVSLDEWGSKKVTGRVAVLTMNETMFREMPEIEFRIVNTVANDFSSFVELEALVSKASKKVLRIVDVLYFTVKEPHKICMVKAYRGF